MQTHSVYYFLNWMCRIIRFDSFLFALRFALGRKNASAEPPASIIRHNAPPRSLSNGKLSIQPQYRTESGKIGDPFCPDFRCATSERSDFGSARFPLIAKYRFNWAERGFEGNHSHFLHDLGCLRSLELDHKLSFFVLVVNHELWAAHLNARLDSVPPNRFDPRRRMCEPHTRAHTHAAPILRVCGCESACVRLGGWSWLLVR